MPLIAESNAAEGKDPDFGHAGDWSDAGEGMAGTARSNFACNSSLRFKNSGPYTQPPTVEAIQEETKSRVPGGQVSTPNHPGLALHAAVVY